MELPREIMQRIEEAGKDVEWVEKVRGAATWETYEKLMAEKGIEAPTELKDTFEAGRINKTRKLEDDELEKVSGGWIDIFCQKKYDYLTCELAFCPD